VRIPKGNFPVSDAEYLKILNIVCDDKLYGPFFPELGFL
jgi:hypothetical protein